jgi:hypothetical protein
MNKVLLLGIVLVSFTFSNAQTKKNDLNVGVHFGTQEYRGDIDNEFFTGKQNSAYGISLSKYITPWFDVLGMVTYSTLDNGDSTSSFETKFLDFNIMAKMKLNNGKWLKETSLIQPYLVLGFGDGVSWADHYIKNSKNMSVDLNLLGGIGINFVISERLGFNLMSKYTYMWNDDFDNRSSKGRNFQDQLLITTIGLNYRFTIKKDADKDGVVD